ncbi:MAG: DUF420 domain-containing protein [Deltaproteobacteria bacterium]|nr:DUF420 domain-containing protein [Deltaproteobacteria bacterium]
MNFSWMPPFHATLNGLSALFITVGVVQIKRGKREKHKACLLTACVFSAIFLISYIVYHSQVGSIPFQGQGWLRKVYFSILFSHTILAIAIVPLIAITLYRALSGRFFLHRKIARFTFPVWLYVSVTGVVIYLMLYHLSA